MNMHATIDSLQQELTTLRAQLTAANARADAAEEKLAVMEKRKGMATEPCKHDSVSFVFSAGDDAPGKSLDTISQCTVCGAIIHDYRHGGGMTSPNYPVVYESPLTVPFRQLAQQLIEAERDAETYRQSAFELEGRVESLRLRLLTAESVLKWIDGRCDEESADEVSAELRLWDLPDVYETLAEAIVKARAALDAAKVPR